MISRQARTTVRVTMVVGRLMLAAPLAAQPAAPRGPDEQMLKRRYQITLMENVLSSAVRHAAETMGRRIQAVTPNVVLMTGTARARGFVLPDYGLFFDVEVPALPMSVAWTMRVMERDFDVDRSLQIIRQNLTSLSDSQRKDVEQALRRIELSVGPVGPPGASPAVPGGARATEVGAAAPASSAAPRAASPAGSPDEDYTEVVKNALIDAMLDYSGPMSIGTDDWLVVAARDAYGPIAPGEIYDAITLVLRVKGSDLAAFRADRITRDEARRRVEVREF